MSRLERACTAVLAAALIAGSSLAVQASPAERLERARGAVERLEDRLREQGAALQTGRERLLVAQRAYDEAAQRLGLIVSTKIQVEADLAASERRWLDARDQLSALAAAAFMAAGTGSLDAGPLGALLGGEEPALAADRVVFAGIVADRTGQVALEVERLQADLEQRAAAVDALLEEQRVTVAALEGGRDEVAAAAAEEQTAYAQLAAARDEVIALIADLEERVAPGFSLDLSGLDDALRGEHHVSYGRWAELFLQMFDAPACRANVVVVVAWQAAEGTQAAWNPLATTHRMEGSTDFNSVGVQNFVSLAQGLQGTYETIANGWDVYRYGAIVRSLRRCAPAMQTALAINASSWCPGCTLGRYVLNVVPNVDADLEAYLGL